MYKSKNGFTLIELLIVIAILGIIAVVAVTSYVGVQLKAMRSEASSNLESLRLLEEQLFVENACYQSLVGGVCPAGPTIITYNATDANDGGIEDILRRFIPGGCRNCAAPYGLNFTYQIRVANGVGLPTPVAVPYVPWATAGLADANTPCFIATATGVAGTRVAGDVFAIDCNNAKTFNNVYL